MGKRTHGKVTVGLNRGKLRLVWTHQGTRYFLHTGYPDEPKYRRVAELKAAQIEEDILFGRFDITLAKYKTGVQAAKPKQTILEIWTAYCDATKEQMSQTTHYATFRDITNKLKISPVTNPNEAHDLYLWLIKNYSPRYVNVILGYIRRAFDWAQISPNPLAELKVKVPKRKNKQIEAFTTSEVQLILETAKTFCPTYASLIEFLFRTGARPSEAIGLRWADVDTKNFSKITFSGTLTRATNGIKRQANLKTQAKRVVPCNTALQNLLRDLYENKSANELIFLSKNKKPILWGYFYEIWTRLLIKCEIKHCKPYAMRHTFITLALESGMDAKDVAALVGNSAEVIYKHYASAKRQLELPEI